MTSIQKKLGRMGICKFYAISIHSPSSANCQHLNCSNSPLPPLSLLPRIAGASAGEGNLCSHGLCRAPHSRKCPWHRCCDPSGATVIPRAAVIARITGLVPWLSSVPHELHTSWVSVPPSALTQSRELLKTAKNNFAPRQKKGYTSLQSIKLLEEIGTASFGFICIFYLFPAALRKSASGILGDKTKLQS